LYKADDLKQQKSFYKHEHYALAYTFMSGYYDRLNWNVAGLFGKTLLLGTLLLARQG